MQVLRLMSFLIVANLSRWLIWPRAYEICEKILQSNAELRKEIYEDISVILESPEEAAEIDFLLKLLDVMDWMTEWMWYLAWNLGSEGKEA